MKLNCFSIAAPTPMEVQDLVLIPDNSTKEQLCIEEVTGVEKDFVVNEDVSVEHDSSVEPNSFVQQHSTGTQTSSVERDTTTRCDVMKVEENHQKSC